MMKRSLPEGYNVRYEHHRYRDDDVNAALEDLAADPTLRPRDIQLPALTTYKEKRAAVISPSGGATIAHVYDEDGNEVVAGMAKCSIIDPFNRQIARDIALGRALKELGVR